MTVTVDGGSVTVEERVIVEGDRVIVEAGNVTVLTNGTFNVVNAFEAVTVTVTTLNRGVRLVLEVVVDEDFVRCVVALDELFFRLELFWLDLIVVLIVAFVVDFDVVVAASTNVQTRLKMTNMHSKCVEFDTFQCIMY